MLHSEHEHPESASLDTAAEYSASCTLFSHSTTLNCSDFPPFSLPATLFLSILQPLVLSAAAAALRAPLSLRGSPLIALHITLNHHNNKSTLSDESPRGASPKDPPLTDVINSRAADWF